MSTKSRTKSQAAKDRAALKRLQRSGNYLGKIDLRKAPTRYQLKKIAELKAARKAPAKTKPKAKPSPKAKPTAKGKAKPSKAKARPQPPPNKSGVKTKRKTLTQKQVSELKEPNQLTTYALPFMRKGREEPEWRRFTYKQLRDFMLEYKPDDPEGAAEWLSYAVAETWHFETPKAVKAERKRINQFSWGERIATPKGRVKKPLVNKGRKKRKPRK